MNQLVIALGVTAEACEAAKQLLLQHRPRRHYLNEADLKVLPVTTASWTSLDKLRASALVTVELLEQNAASTRYIFGEPAELLHSSRRLLEMDATEYFICQAPEGFGQDKWLTVAVVVSAQIWAKDAESLRATFATEAIAVWQQIPHFCIVHTDGRTEICS